jgi:hypothetical protein
MTPGVVDTPKRAVLVRHGGDGTTLTTAFAGLPEPAISLTQGSEFEAGLK